MRTVARMVLTVAALVAVGMSAGPALATTIASGQVTGVVTGSAAGQAPAPSTLVAEADGSNGSAATDGSDDSNINEQRHDADAAHSRTKIIIGVVVVGLLAIVYFGHRQRAKSRVRKKNLRHAKS